MINPKIACVIPARMKSTRFPGKPLTLINGIPMLVRVYERVRHFQWEHICVATDSQEIVDVCKDNNMNWIMTGDHHKTGTDRICEAAKQIDCDYVVNVQGDEPIIPRNNVKAVIDAIIATRRPVINAFTSVNGEGEESPNTIKVVVDSENNLVYMSRLPVPYSKTGKFISRNKQVCVYGFSKYALDWFASKSTCVFEQQESIEILRFLENPLLKPYMVRVSPGTVAVDVPEDVLKVEEVLNAGF